MSSRARDVDQVDVGYRDPDDDRENPTRPPGPTIEHLTREQLEQELAFGGSMRQLLARDELRRRAGEGYQPSLLPPLDRLRS